MGLHATFVLRDDNSILSYGTRNTGIEGFCPTNVSRDFGKTWQVTRSPMPAQGGGQNPIMLRLQSGRLLYVSDIREAKDPALIGFTGAGSYACLSEDGGATWKIRRLVGGQTNDEHGKSVTFRTVGYAGVAQTPNGVIHLVTSRNKPDLHVELNEAWILATDSEALEAASVAYTSVIGDTVKQREEFYAEGKVRAKWAAGVNAQGLYLLDGEQRFFYPDGQLQWKVTYRDGLKVGEESYYRPDRTVQWQRRHEDEGRIEWTVFYSRGRKKAVSNWQDKRLLNYQVH